ncbi:hypothetical protein H4219_002581 [Mycoemilia scoparia]|uniref:Uncharacterized protein n=1 Tax=Mycoemilia scoparia TaxID=417184 RepID=A0A9W7ZX67_9FUNG|nr:hypothetical protein H4219_002581 [Mycoemilia scoparia]
METRNFKKAGSTRENNNDNKNSKTTTNSTEDTERPNLPEKGATKNEPGCPSCCEEMIDYEIDLNCKFTMCPNLDCAFPFNAPSIEKYFKRDDKSATLKQQLKKKKGGVEGRFGDKENGGGMMNMSSVAGAQRMQRRASNIGLRRDTMIRSGDDINKNIALKRKYGSISGSFVSNSENKVSDSNSNIAASNITTASTSSSGSSNNSSSSANKGMHKNAQPQTVPGSFTSSSTSSSDERSSVSPLNYHHINEMPSEKPNDNNNNNNSSSGNNNQGGEDEYDESQFDILRSLSFDIGFGDQEYGVNGNASKRPRHDSGCYGDGSHKSISSSLATAITSSTSWIDLSSLGELAAVTTNHDGGGTTAPQMPTSSAGGNCGQNDDTTTYDTNKLLEDIFKSTTKSSPLKNIDADSVMAVTEAESSSGLDQLVRDSIFDCLTKSMGSAEQKGVGDQELIMTSITESKDDSQPNSALTSDMVDFSHIFSTPAVKVNSATPGLKNHNENDDGDCVDNVAAAATTTTAAAAITSNDKNSLDELFKGSREFDISDLADFNTTVTTNPSSSSLLSTHNDSGATSTSTTSTKKDHDDNKKEEFTEEFDDAEFYKQLFT